MHQFGLALAGISHNGLPEWAVLETWMPQLDSAEIREHWFGFSDHCIGVQEVGRGPPLFFLHGRFGHAEIWKPMVELLARNFRCYLIDYPGFGRSFSAQEKGLTLIESAVLVDRLLNEFLLPNEKAVIIGHDTGGATAQLAALRCSDQVSGLVLINSASLSEKLAASRPTFGSRWRFHGKLKHWIRQSRSLPEEAKISLNSLWGQRSLRRGWLSALEVLEDSWPAHYERLVWKNKLRHLTHPILLLWGENEKLNPCFLATEIMKCLPEVYFYKNGDLGHWPPLEDPEWVLYRMQEFLFKLATRTEDQAQAS